MSKPIDRLKTIQEKLQFIEESDIATNTFQEVETLVPLQILGGTKVSTSDKQSKP